MDNNALIVLDKFEELPNRSLAKDLSDLLTFASEEIRVITDEEATKLQRLVDRLGSAARALVGAFHQRSLLAEELYDIQQEEDWKLLLNPQTGHPYRWHEFRERLASAFGVSTGTIGNYLKMVRLAREALLIEPGHFASVGGIVTTSHVLDITVGHDGRSKESLAMRLRPISVQADKNITDAIGEQHAENSFIERLQRYFRECVAHNYEDPSALNKDSGQLRQQADEIAGRAKLWITRKMNGGTVTAYELHLQYPDFEEGGVMVMSDEEVTILRIEGFLPATAREWLERRLKVR